MAKRCRTSPCRSPVVRVCVCRCVGAWSNITTLVREADRLVSSPSPSHIHHAMLCMTQPSPVCHNTCPIHPARREKGITEVADTCFQSPEYAQHVESAIHHRSKANLVLHNILPHTEAVVHLCLCCRFSCTCRQLSEVFPSAPSWSSARRTSRRLVAMLMCAMHS